MKPVGLQISTFTVYLCSSLQMEVRYDIDDEDEELTLEDFVDQNMRDWELSQVESVYTLASNCLHERKNRRPIMEQVE